MPISTELSDQVQALMTKARQSEREYQRLDSYYEGQQRLKQIGIAVPPELRMFETVVNVPRMSVDEPEGRQNLRGFQTSGSKMIDKRLREGWEANNLDSQSHLVHKDARLFGRSFVTVSTNPDDVKTPLITAESPEGFAVDVSPRRQMRAALRVYKDETDRRQRATLYLPNATHWLIREARGWEHEDEPDEHALGRVPVVMFLNRPRTGRWGGVSEMADVIGMTDAIARIITNMQIAAEAKATPHRWAAGLSRDDFVDSKTGKPIPAWEAYLTAIMVTGNKDAKFGTFDAAELSNFHNTVNEMLAWCAAMLGLPTRFMGNQTVNPASEGAIRADEVRLVRNVERKNKHDGDSWAWVMDLYQRFATGKWPATNSTRALWFDPSTPTQAQLTDAVVKLRQSGVLSREGTWDELGWDEPRKDRERGYFAAEAAENPDAMLAKALTGGNGGAE